MFRIRADYNDQFEVGANLAQARAFFGDPLNFVGMMPGVEKITSEANGDRRWTIRADVPLIGALRQTFIVRSMDAQDDRIEWGPAANEKNNLLRYAAAFEEIGPRTLIRLAQRVELRRQQAKELHLLAGLIGERKLSAEMQTHVTEMMRAFLRHARARLENKQTNV